MKTLTTLRSISDIDSGNGSDGSRYCGKRPCMDDQAQASISCLPEEVWQNIALNLSAPDVLSLISVNRQLYYGLGQTVNLWDVLSDRDGSSCYEEDGFTEPSRPLAPSKKSSGDEKKNFEEGYCDWRTKKSSYKFQCHKSNPSKSGGGVRWYPVRPYGPCVGISDREGHLSCVLSRDAISHQMLGLSTSSVADEKRKRKNPQERTVVITGGYSNDDSIYLVNAGTGSLVDSMDASDRPHRHWEMKRAEAIGQGPSFVYGATLTALPTLYTESAEGEGPRTLTATMRAIRFGGFKAGGYSNETSQIVMLTVKQDAIKVRKRRQRRGKRDRQCTNNYDDDSNEDSWSTLEWHWNRPWQIKWSPIATTGIAPGENDEENSPERDFLSRAYHTATLLLDRYLVVIGGMKSVTSVINEAILDTKTWTWIGYGAIACGSDGMNDRPSGRHGHSVILDDFRNRLVLFGGGSGSDLLRSGEDNSEVWELQFGDGWRDAEKFAESFPWKWNKVHKDSNVDWSGDESSAETADDNTFKLSSSESLCLGRCHNGIKISRDTVLFLFGSGKPSTNGLLAYDLKNDDFFRRCPSPQRSLSTSSPSTASPDSFSSSSAVHVKGILPKPRFTGTAAFLEEDGYIITHGGFCSQDRDTIGTMDVLDLAPGLRGHFGGLSFDDRRVPYEEVTDSQAEEGRRDGHSALKRMLHTLMNAPPGERQAVAATMLEEMRRGDRPADGQSLILMTMVASGTPLFMGNEDQNEDQYTGMESD